MLQTKVVQKIKTRVMFSNRFFFPRKSYLLWDNVKKYFRPGQVTDDNLAYAHCLLGTKGYRHILGISNTYCNNGCTIASQWYVILTLPVRPTMKKEPNVCWVLMFSERCNRGSRYSGMRLCVAGLHILSKRRMLLTQRRCGTFQKTRMLRFLFGVCNITRWKKKCLVILGFDAKTADWYSDWPTDRQF